TAAPVASSIIHEGIHARVERMGVRREGRDRAREERLCRRAELEFGMALPPELGAPVIERAIESLALADEEVALVAAFALPLGVTLAQHSGPPPGLGAAAIARLDELPRLRQSVFVGNVSSYDPSEKNDDGFSGEHSFIRKEGDGLVVAELTGPGVLYRFHTPTPTE